MNKRVVIVGGGIAGLNCARLLHQAQVPCLVLEASDGIGGRVRTDWVEGFAMDRGFQVLQEAYPEVQQALRLDRLQLVELEPGAMVRRAGRWVTMSDPRRRPTQALRTLWNPIGRLSDRFKLLRLWRDCSRGSVEGLLQAADDITTEQLLRDRYRFSGDFVNGFLRPWLAGIFLETQLATSANYFRFVFRMLASGRIVYPSGGMGEIPQQLATGLGPESIRLNAAVQSLRGTDVSLASGETISADALVLATDVSTAAQLTEQRIADVAWRGTRCIYFAAPQPPRATRMLMIRGAADGPVNHVFTITQVAPRLAPAGQALVSVSQMGAAATAAYDPTAVRSELRDWFGPEVDAWRQLRVYDLPHALPAQPPGSCGALRSTGKLPPGQFVCGDYCETTSLNGALKSGRLAAERVLLYLAAT